MERLNTQSRGRWEALRGELAHELKPLTRAFFRDLPPSEIDTIAALVDGGKQSRGYVALVVCEALGGRVADALPGAVAVECVHAASLIHDDIVDGDRVRRDGPATWTVFGSRRAVLLGDVMFATVLARMAEIDGDAMVALSRAIAHVAAGAYREPLDADELRTLVADQAPQALYERIVALKTGALFGAAAELGAIAAHATWHHRRAAFEFGARIGEAFQIADDLTDVVLRDTDTLTPQQHVTRAALGACFGIDSDANGAAATGAHQPTARIEAAMQAAIGDRIALARQVVGQLKASAASPSLHDLPDVILAQQHDEARPTASS